MTVTAETKQIFVTEDGTEFDNEVEARIHDVGEARGPIIRAFLAEYVNQTPRSQAMAHNIITAYEKFLVERECV